MIKLFYAPGTCALAIHITLEWIGEPYETQQVKLGDPEYLKINPLGQVPAIIDGGGDVMTQGDAILKYLARKYPAAKLGDDGTLQDGYDLVQLCCTGGNRSMAFLTGDLHPAFFPFYKPERYSTDSSDLAKQATKEASYKLIDRMYKYLDRHLNGKEFVVGNRLTIAGAYAFAMVRWGNSLPHGLTNYPNLNRFYHYWCKDMGAKQAMKQQHIH
jgi:glutathione S-transferase